MAFRFIGIWHYLINTTKKGKILNKPFVNDDYNTAKERWV